MARDFREERDAARLARKLALENRRVGGASFEGGQSEAQTTISSPTGLAETETIQLSAVNAFTVVTEDDDIALAAFAPAGITTTTDLMSVEFIAGGTPLLITFRDDCDVLVDSGTTDLVTVDYTMTITDPSGNAITDSVTGLAMTTTQTIVSVFGPTFGYAALFPTVAASGPYLTILANGLVEGLHYLIDISFRGFRQDTTDDDLTADSLNRILTIQEVKR